MFKKFMKQQSDTKTQASSDNLDDMNIPKHVAIIMDGNGRWAKQKSLPRIAGHREGMKVINKVVSQANTLGVEALTLYAFSTENWKRPKSEVDFLLRLPERFLSMELPKLMEENVKVRLTGSINDLPEHTLRAVETAVEKTSENTGLILNFALNYGSRFEMIQAVKDIARDVQSGGISTEEIDEEMFASKLMTSGLVDPDLLIRTSGELRLSNFMLWQLAYSEFWFTDVLWPDFNEEHFLEAVRVYQRRTRRYGGI